MLLFSCYFPNKSIYELLLWKSNKKHINLKKKCKVFKESILSYTTICLIYVLPHSIPCSVQVTSIQRKYVVKHIQNNKLIFGIFGGFNIALYLYLDLTWYLRIFHVIYSKWCKESLSKLSDDANPKLNVFLEYYFSSDKESWAFMKISYKALWIKNPLQGGQRRGRGRGAG